MAQSADTAEDARKPFRFRHVPYTATTATTAAATTATEHTTAAAATTTHTLRYQFEPRLLNPYQLHALLCDLVAACADIRAALTHADTQTPAAVSSVQYTPLRCSVRPAAAAVFFDRLRDTGVVRASGHINRSISRDRTVHGERLRTRLQELCVDEGSESWPLYSADDRAELLFHIMQQLVLGGSAHDTLDVYVRAAVAVYKEAAGTIAARVDSVNGTPFALYGACVVVVDTTRQQVTVLLRLPAQKAPAPSVLTKRKHPHTTAASAAAAASASDTAIVVDDHDDDVDSARPTVRQFDFATLGRHKAIDSQIAIVESTLQQGMTCGFWSVFNAKAIDDILEQGAALTAAGIASGTRKYAHCITTKKPLWTEQVSSAAKHLSVDIVLLGIYPEHGVLPLIADLALDEKRLAKYVGRPLNERDQLRLMSENVDDVMAQLISSFRARVDSHPSTAAALHFVCNVGSRRAGHWVLLSVVLLPHTRPFILVLDSTNAFVFTRPMALCCDFIRRHLSRLAGPAAAAAAAAAAAVVTTTATTDSKG